MALFLKGRESSLPIKCLFQVSNTFVQFTNHVCLFIYLTPDDQFFHKVFKKNKIPRKKPKKAKDLYSEHYKTPMKEIENK